MIVLVRIATESQPPFVRLRHSLPCIGLAQSSCVVIQIDNPPGTVTVNTKSCTELNQCTICDLSCNLPKFGEEQYGFRVSGFSLFSSETITLLTAYFTRSFKDVFRVVVASFNAPDPPYRLPSELQDMIELFLRTNQETDDRVHEELLSIYKKHVADRPQWRALFLALLRALQPAIRGEQHLTEWWSLVVRPAVTTIGYKRDEIEDARDFLLGVLAFESDDEPIGDKAHISAALSRNLINEYLAHSTVSASGEDEFIAHELESIISSYGRRKPKVCCKCLLY
jgi:hypothetical protein